MCAVLTILDANAGATALARLVVFYVQANHKTMDVMKSIQLLQVPCRAAPRRTPQLLVTLGRREPAHTGMTTLRSTTLRLVDGLSARECAQLQIGSDDWPDLLRKLDQAHKMGGGHAIAQITLCTLGTLDWQALPLRHAAADGVEVTPLEWLMHGLRGTGLLSPRPTLKLVGNDRTIDGEQRVLMRGWAATHRMTIDVNDGPRFACAPRVRWLFTEDGHATQYVAR